MTEKDQLPEEQLQAEGIESPVNAEIIEEISMPADVIEEVPAITEAEPESSAESTGEPADEAALEPEKETSEEQVAELVSEAVAEPVAEAQAEPVAEVTDAAVAEVVEVPAADPGEETVIPEAVPDMAGETIAEPAAEPASQPDEEPEEEPDQEPEPESEPAEEVPAEVPEPASEPEVVTASGEQLPPVNVDYTGYSRQALLEALTLLLSQRTIQEIARDAENIRSVFYRKLKQEADEKLKRFMEEGGVVEEYKPAPDPLEDSFKQAFEEFRHRRTEYSKAIEGDKEENLRKKVAIIEQIKHLLNTQESLNKTFNEFRDLQRQWRDIGPVPQTELHSLWENYHHHVERFYDYIKINKELRDLDLKRNLETKIHICEKAEELLLEPSVVKSFAELQLLHNQWREIGPVPGEKKDEIWERFREATNQINKKHQEFYVNLKDEQKNNLEAKNHLCEQIEEILEKAVSNPKDWNELSQEVVKLQQMWRSIGFAPRKDNNKVYDRFRAACDEFFNRKREYFSRHRDDQHTNLQLKTDLCIQAEALSNSNEWKKTSDELVTIQKKWKEIGPVPRKYSDQLWNRFRTACDTFFRKKAEHFSSQDSEQAENLKLKLELVERVKQFKLSDDHHEDLATLKEIQKEFTTIGHVPIEKKDEVQREFREALRKLFDQLEVDEPKNEIIRYKHKVDSFAQSPKNRNRISSEREKLVTKLKQMESDVVLWENNIGFFAKSQKSESLIREFENKIAQEREKIQLLKEKIDLLDRFES